MLTRLRRTTSDADDIFMSKRLWTRSETRIWQFNFFMGTCVLYASRVALPMCATVIAQEYGWNKTDSGTVLSCFFYGYAITQLFAGAIADKYGGEKVLRISTIWWIIFTFFIPQLFDFAYWSGSPLTVLLFVRIMYGIGQGFHVPSMASIVSRHLTAADKGRVFGVSLAGSHFGNVVAGSIGSLLIDWFGWRSLFQFVGVISFIWWFFFIRLVRETSYRRGGSDKVKDSSNDLLLEEESPKKVNSVKILPAPAQSSVPWCALFSHTAFWAASVAQYCGANAYFTMFSWLPSYFHDNFPDAKGIVFNVVPNAAIVVTSIAAPFISSKLLSSGKSMTFTRRVMEGVSLIAIALCLVLVSFTSDYYMALLYFSLAMTARGLHHGGVSVNPHDFAPNHTGSVFGIFNAFSAITGFIGVYAAGVILAYTANNWSYVFIFAAVQCTFGAVVYSLLGTGKQII
ncbi:hypothetical protein QR680_013647 [Steinernema hermaphroditum]|uniref:Major facilitator superfamily (MFS) profile domain-containing protein n=1 Tax=Steinernema hermaphroditum TaxID=289476 RepID=A0AA39I667_9BILA|nr:hypothetical protein QR680_013647 [Steinernema hermaphroditum]